jgi:hypothetical protein
MKTFVLIIDDEIQDREPYYRTLIKAVVDGGEIGQVEPIFLKKPEGLPAILGKYDFACALVDAVFAHEGWDQSSLTAIAAQIAARDIPFSVVSKRFDSANSEHITEAFGHFECKAFLKWDDIQQSRKYPVVMLCKMIAESMGTAQLTSCEPNEPIYLLHTSDTHFGGHPSERFKNETLAIEQVIRPLFDSKPPFIFVVISGDISEHGYSTEYAQAEHWLKDLARRLGISDADMKHRVLLCPGNHDVNVPVGLLAHNKLASQKGEAPTLEHSDTLNRDEDWAALSMEQYRLFSQRVSSHTEVAKFTWIESGFRHLGLDFYGLSSVEPTINGWPLRNVDEASVRSVMDGLRGEGSQEANLLRIGLCHHSPLADVNDNCISNPDALNQLFGNNMKTAIFLHGHMHRAEFSHISQGNHRLLLVRAPSPTKKSSARPEDTLRGFNLLKIVRAFGLVKGVEAQTYEWRDGRLRAEGDRPRTFVLKADGMLQEGPIPKPRAPRQAAQPDEG